MQRQQKLKLRRILAFILSLSMIFGDIPVLPTVMRAEAASFDGGTIMDAYYDDEDVVLNGDVTISQNFYIYDHDLIVNDDLTITLKDDSSKFYLIGGTVRISSGKTLTISGNGSTYIHGKDAEAGGEDGGVAVSGNVIINGGDCKIYGGSADSANGGNAVNGDITVNGGNCRIYGGDSAGSYGESYGGFGVNGNFTIVGGTAIISGGYNISNIYSKAISGTVNYINEYVLIKGRYDNSLISGSITDVSGLEFIDHLIYDLKYAKIDLPERNFVYNRSAQIPELSVSFNGTALIKDTDYSIIYEEEYTHTVVTAPVDFGTYIIKIEGKGDYVGSYSTFFNISRKKLNIYGLSALNKEYDGTDNVELSYDNLVIDGILEGDDVTISGIEGQFCDASAGKDKLIQFTYNIDGAQSFNYSPDCGTVSADITPREVSLTWSDTTLSYNGTERKPYATAGNLIEGDTCTVTVSGGQINAGTYTATATALSNSNYKLPAVKTVSFNITKVDLGSYVAPTAKPGLIYTGDEQELIEAGLVNGGSISYSLSENGVYSEDIPVGIDAGDYTVYYIITCDDNHNGDVASSVSACIEKAPVEATVIIEDWEYGAEASVPTVSGNSGNAAVTYMYKVKGADDSTYSSDVPTGVGTYTVSANIAESSNYLAGYATADFEIFKTRSVVINAPAAKELTYNGEDQELVNAGTAEGGKMLYSLDENDGFEENIPAGKDAGDYTVYYMVKGDADHSDSLVCSVNAAISRKAACVSADNCSKVFGQDDPGFSATVSGNIGSDVISYSISRNSGEHTGTYTLTPSGNAVQGNYDVTYLDGVFTITAKPIIPVASLSSNSFVYDGTEKTPEVTLMDGTTQLAPEDYSVSYNSNINAGTASVNIAAAVSGNYIFDDITLNFTIEKAPISPIVVIADHVLGTSVSAPYVIGNPGNGAVTYSYKVKDADDSTYGSGFPAEKGRYTVKATIAESGNYLGGTATADFRIVDAAASIITAPTAKPGLAYNGTEQELITAGTAKSGTMAYTLNPEESFGPDIPKAKEAGEYTVYYKALGDDDNGDSPMGSVSVSIARAEARVTAYSKHKQYGEADPELTVSVNGTYGDDKLEYTVRRYEGEDVGTYLITVKGEAVQGSYNVSYTNAEFTIYARQIKPTVSLSELSYTYDGYAKKPSVRLFDGTEEIDEEFYTVTYANNINAGTADITISPVEDANITFQTFTVNFTINKAPIYPMVYIVNWALGQTPAQPAITNNTGKGKVTYEYKLKEADDSAYSSEVPTAVGDYTIKATVEETANYLGASVTADFKILKEGVAVSKAPVSKNDLKYTGKTYELIIPGESEDGTMNYAIGMDDKTAPHYGWSISIPTGLNAGTYYVWYKARGDAEHADSTPACIPVIIDKADQPKPAAPVAVSISSNSVTLSANSAYEFKCDNGEWGESSEFNGLEAARTYSFYQRVKGDQNHYPSDSSDALVVRTKTATPAAVSENSTELRFLFENATDSWKEVYTGSKITPAVLGYSGNTPLAEGIDYSVSYSKNVNAGTAKISITGKGDYKGKYELSFTIDPKQLDDGNGNPAEGIIVSGLNAAENAKPSPAVYYNGMNISKKVNVAIEADDTVTISAKEKGNFSGCVKGLAINRVSSKDEINKKAIKANKVKVDLTYNGESQLLGDALKVCDVDNKPLKEGVDYIVSYSSDTVNAGKVKYSVIGIGAYTGIKNGTYVIKPAKNAAVNISFVQEDAASENVFAYVKSGVKPVVIASTTLNGCEVTLKEGRDFKVSYSNNKKIGSAAKAQITMLNNYKGAKAVSKTFTIEKADFKNAEIYISDMLYTKPAKYYAKPIVTIGGALVPESEYKVYYSIKDKITLNDSNKDVSVSVTIMSKGQNYKDGELSATYRVYKAADSITDISKAKVTLIDRNSGRKLSKVAYTGKAISFDPSDEYRQADLCVTIGKTVIKGADVYKYFDVSYADNTVVGKAAVIVSAKQTTADGNANIYSGVAGGKFNISKRSIKRAK